MNPTNPFAMLIALFARLFKIPMKAAAFLLLILLALTLGSNVTFAGAFDLFNSDTNVITGAVTNTYALSGDTTVFTNGTVLPANKLTAANSIGAWFSATGYFTNTAATVANVAVTLYPSVDTFNYLTASNIVFYIPVPAGTTNWYTGGIYLTGAFPQYSCRSIGNTNASCTSGILKLKGFTKAGI